MTPSIASRPGWRTLWHDASGNRHGNIVLHREVPGTDHYGCPDRCVNALPVDRIIKRANELLGGDDMSAEDVWNFNQNGVLMRDRLQGTDAAANATKKELFRLSQWDRRTHASALGNLVVEQPVQGGAKLGDRVAGIDAKTSQLVTQVAALTEAVKTLAESKGGRPGPDRGRCGERGEGQARQAQDHRHGRFRRKISVAPVSGTTLNRE